MSHIAVTRYLTIPLSVGLTVASFVLIAQSGASTAPAKAPVSSGAPLSLSGGAPSIDALLDAFLAALEHQDAAALHALRVSKDEYLQIIVPGTVEKGGQPRRMSGEPLDFYWQLTDRKSRYAAENILGNFGGRHFTARTLSLTKGTTEYLWYAAHGQVRLDLRSADGQGAAHLKTGTIAEVDGRYKFLAFNWND